MLGNDEAHVENTNIADARVSHFIKNFLSIVKKMVMTPNLNADTH